MKDNQDFIKHVIDAISAVFAVGSLMQWIPVTASIFTIVWYMIRIWESKTIQNFVAKWKASNAV
jgi:hypothetical protein